MKPEEEDFQYTENEGCAPSCVALLIVLTIFAVAATYILKHF